MPKAILAIRTYPATVILAMLLFLATLVVTAGSMGKVTTDGGDSGDGGSGIGGTGRSGEFDGSGFGGTGAPSPFFTSTETDNRTTDASDIGITAAPILVEKVLVVEQLDTATPEAQLAVTPTQKTISKPAASELQQAIVESVERNELVKQNDLILTIDVAAEDAELVVPVEKSESQPLQLVESLVVPVSRQPDEQTAPLALSQEVELASTAESAISASSPTQQPAIDIPMMIDQQAETLSVKLETADSGEPDIDRRSLPDRIQRPELPPIQRIRPVERVSNMPPRVQPMRI